MLTLRKTAKFNVSIFLITLACALYADYQESIGIFTIHADQKDSLIVKELAGFFIESQARYTLFFNHVVEKPIRVYLASTDEDYNHYNLTHIPEWSSGVAYTKQRLIVLKPGLYYDPVRYKETVYHELAHIFVAEIVQEKTIPVWFNEGIAMYLSGKSISWGESITIGNALSAGKIIGLRDMDSLFTFSDARAELGYLESFMAVQFLIARYNESIISAILRDMKTGPSFDQVFFKQLGYGLDVFEIDWYDDLKTRYRWVGMLQFENLLWISLVIIFFLVYIRIKLRNRRIYKSWDQDELSI